LDFLRPERKEKNGRLVLPESPLSSIGNAANSGRLKAGLQGKKNERRRK